MNKIIDSLNKDSKKLFKITKNIKYEKDFNIHKHKLIKKIYKINKNKINKNHNYKIKSLIYNYDKYKNLLNFDFISKKIINNINKKVKIVYEINYNNTTILLFSRYKKMNIKIKNKINNIINIIEIIRECFKNKKKLNINMFPSTLKKKIPIQNKIIGPDNCNSGLTFFPYHNENGIVVIFREEEYKKVLFHECIHALRGDELLWDKLNNKEIFNKYCLNLFEYNKININETYTEFLASILNQIYIIVSLKLNIKLINKLYKYESIYSLLKVKQILNHYNYKDINKIYNSKKCKIFNQKTSVLSYYIFKTALYFNSIKALDFYYNCSDNFKINYVSIDTFIKLIIKSNDYLLLDIINKINIDNVKNKSLRMTLFE